MAKRQLEEDTSATGPEEPKRATKKLKQQKKKAKVEAILQAEAQGLPSAHLVGQLSKYEQKAIKRAKKRAITIANDVDGHREQAEKERKQRKAQKLAEKEARKAEVAAAKVERKALKRAEREAKKASASEDSEDVKKIIPNVTVSTKVDEEKVVPKQSDLGEVYVQAAGLTSLPQAEIDRFIAEHQLAVEDPRNQLYRPITSFDYLEVDDAQRAPFANFSAPTPIQAACWPYLLAGRDVVGVAETGSGKTLAFGVPCIRSIARLDKKAKKGIQACIVSPTRELALQINEQLVKIAEPAGLKVTCVYGGVNKDEQRATLRGTHVVVATPGRLNDFIQEGSIDLSKTKYLVLDEADRMLDKGFEQDVRRIFEATVGTGRQTLMFTATWPPSVRELADTFMDQPVKVTIGDNASGELRANTRIVQEVEVIQDFEKQGRLIELLKQYQSGKNKNDKILVFCLYKKEATRIEEFIRRKGYNVAGIHGDLNQQKRTESLAAFKNGQVPLLVATDVAARGLDIPAVKLVINVTFPLTVEDYVHRIGRTGRAGQDGRAITMFTENEKGLAGALINVLKAANQAVPEDLMKFGTTVKKKGHDAYGAFYKPTADMPKAKKITFD